MIGCQLLLFTVLLRSMIRESSVLRELRFLPTMLFPGVLPDGMLTSLLLVLKRRAAEVDLSTMLLLLLGENITPRSRDRLLLLVVLLLGLRTQSRP